MRLLFALSGFHRIDRGAETALLAVAQELARRGHEVTVAGSGHERPDTSYDFIHVPAMSRERFERWPALPFFRNETQWEDATFAARLGSRVDIGSHDATVTCAYPYTSWALRRGGGRPAHIFVTQNGDWPAVARTAEYRFFGCDGLVCTNPAYLQHNEERWNCALVPNGIDLARFSPGPAVRRALSLPEDRPVILMVSAFIDTKRVADGIRAVGKLKNAALVVAGDGPLRAEADTLAAELLPERYHRVSLSAKQMPDLYRSADVFLHMSKWESFGNVYLEAAACGLPVVAHRSDLTQWILGDAPFLCDTENEKELVFTLEQALGADGTAAATDLQRFSWGAIAAEYERFLEGILTGRRQHRGAA